METRLEGQELIARPDTEDRVLRDDVAREARRPGWVAIAVVLDASAILAFVTWVVIPRLA